MLYMERAHFDCPNERCEVLVRFDNEQARTYWATQPSDEAKHLLLIEDYSRFVENLKSAKRVRIEAYFYEKVPRVFTFEVAGLPEELYAAMKDRHNNEGLKYQDNEISSYVARIRLKVQGRVIIPPDLRGNPQAVYEVVLLPGGEVLQATLKRSSGSPAYDEAVERAIRAAQPLPVPTDPILFQSNFRVLELRFKPRE
jgi:TonB family protein